MAFHDEQHEDTPLPLATPEKSFATEQVPQTPDPAPSEQFKFPEVPTTPEIQANPDPLTPPAANVDEASTLANQPVPEQPQFFGEPTLLNANAGQVSFTEYGTIPHPPPYPIPGQTLPSSPSRRRRLDATAIVAICLTILLIILGGGGLIYDLAYYQPHQAQVNATATTNAQATGTVSSASTALVSSENTATAQETATVQTYQSIYTQATSGSPVLNDALRLQNNSNWDVFQQPDKSGACGFQNGSYHASIVNAGFFQPCYENTSSFSNFAVQIDMTILTGDYGGIVFRADNIKGTEYLLEVNVDGQYNLYVFTGFKANEDQSQTILSNTTRYMDSSGSTTITLIAQGNTLYFYLNKNFVGSITDSTLASGLIGVEADDYQHATEVAFRNIKVWNL